MLKLNRDILFLILEELEHDKNSLYSCLLINRTWCEITVPILWKKPIVLTDAAKKALINVIILHLSEESKDILKNQGVDFFTKPHQRPLFNYMSYCRYLDLSYLEDLMNVKNVGKLSLPIINDEIMKLFINRNTKFTHLNIPVQYDIPLHKIPWAEHSFSELEFLSCNLMTNQNVFEGISMLCTSIRKLVVMSAINDNNPGITKLIEAQKNLNEVNFVFYPSSNECENLEKSLFKIVNTVQHLRIYWRPKTKILSYLVNLTSLDLYSSFFILYNTNWSHLENLSLPLLKFLKTQNVPLYIVESLIENTKGDLTKINIDKVDNKLIQAIYQNCPKLEYFELLLYNDNLSELEKLLINCQYLRGLVIFADLFKESDWDYLFEILVKSSPIGLFKFKFTCINGLKLKNLEIFFDGWKNKHPMLLQTPVMETEMHVLVDEYKAKGIIKKFDIDYYYYHNGGSFVDFEWFQQKSHINWLDLSVI
jgi:hypothetical protein